MDPYLPDKSDELFEHLLPKYRENRKRWPLWTYNREPDPDKNPLEQAQRIGPIGRWVYMWSPSTAWADRLQWAPPSHLRAVSARAQHLFEDAGLAVRSWDPGDRWVTTEKDQSLTLHGIDGPIEVTTRNHVQIPHTLAIESIAVVHQLAPKISDDATAVEVPSSKARAGLDHHDYDELANVLIRTLVSSDLRLPEPRGASSDNTDPVNWEINFGHATQSRRFLDRMVWQHTADDDAFREERDTLAREYCESVGILPSRQGAGSVLVHDYRFLKLWSETESLVDFLRGWTPDDELVNKVRTILLGDSYFSERDIHLLAQWGRGNLTTPYLALNHPLGPFVIRLRFPFLRVRELRDVLEREEVGGAWTLSRKQPHRRLLARRFSNWRPEPGDDAVREYLSRVRNRTSIEI